MVVLWCVVVWTLTKGWEGGVVSLLAKTVLVSPRLCLRLRRRRLLLRYLRNLLLGNLLRYFKQRGGEHGTFQPGWAGTARAHENKWGIDVSRVVALVTVP